MRYAVWWLWAFAIVLFTTLPLSNFVGHSHWDYVEWVPFRNWVRFPHHRIDLSLDVLANIVLFMPFGYWHPAVKTRRPGTAILYAVLTAAAFSAAVELYQVYNHRRTASMTDVSCNVVGAAAGVALALKRQGVKHRDDRERYAEQ